MNDIPLVHQRESVSADFNAPQQSMPDFGWDIAPFSHQSLPTSDLPSYDHSVIFGDSSFKNEGQWPTFDSTFAQTSDNSVSDSVKPVLESEAPSLLDQASSLIPEVSSTASLGLGAGLSIANSAFNTSTNNQLDLQAKDGSGPFGHSSAVNMQTQNLTNFNSNVTNLENIALGVGSAFGPEGLVAGGLAAATIGAVSTAFTPSPNLVQGTDGTMVDPSQM
jgi:hypothetical protein